jgi:hypothetical protein
MDRGGSVHLQYLAQEKAVQFGPWSEMRAKLWYDLVSHIPSRNTYSNRHAFQRSARFCKAPR